MGMPVVDWVKDEKTCPLWVAAFPGLRFQTVFKEGGELKTGIYLSAY